MWPRASIVPVFTILLLVIQPTTAGNVPDATPRSEGGRVPYLVHSVSVDGGENGQDEARGLSVAADGTVYVTGYVTVSGQGRNIWLAKYDQTLGFLDSVTINGPADGDDEGYTMAFDGNGFVYLAGYQSEVGEQHNIWIGKFDPGLTQVGEFTLNGSEDDSDDAYGVLFDDVTGNLYVAGTLRELGEGANIWLAVFDTDLVQLDSTTMSGPVVDDTDKARFMAFDDSRHLFVSGSMTQAVTDYDIWIGKFNDDLSFVDDVVVAGPTTEEDKGYGIVFEPPDSLIVTGTMIEPNESYNIWMAKYDTNLNPVDSYTINGPVDGEDVAYLMTRDPAGRIFHSGTYTEAEGGSNIWLAEFDSNIEIKGWTTVDGPAGGFDTGIGVAIGPLGDMYVSAVVSDPVEGLNIWIGRFDITTVFADGFESGDTLEWTETIP